ncbi:MAG: DegT/DnrJ/EryC1/StrS family aminotransferase [Dehalococcoidia bacterium]
MVDAPVKTKVRLMRSVVGSEELAAVARVIEDGYLGMGSEVQKFEQELTQYIGGDREVVCLSTCTAALHLALQCCDIGPGDEVLAPSFTFVATFQAISASGATAVSCEADPLTGFIDVADAERRITSRTKAIMPVHLYGHTGDLDGVYALAKKYNLRVIEDAAQAFGTYHNGNMIGSTGDIVCFSFDGVKQITSGEGGALVTSDLEVANRARDARLLAVEKDTEKRYAGERSWEFDVHDQGYRFHMSNLLAAIGRVQLGRFESEFRPRRVEICERYARLLSHIDGLRILDVDYKNVVPWSFAIFIADGHRDAIREALLAENIECGVQYKPNHTLSRYGGGRESLPVTEQLYEEQLSLPLHPMLTEEEQDRVVDVITSKLEALRG